MLFFNRNVFSNVGNSSLYGGIPNKEINKKVIEKTEEIVGKRISDNTEIKNFSDLGISIDTDSLLANKNIFIGNYQEEIKYEYVTKIQTETKNVSINIDSIVSNSSLAVDYRQNAVRTTPKTFSDNTAYSRAKSLAKQDLEKLAEELKNQIKKQMGEQFDSAKVANLINEAIEKTLKEFSDNQKKGSIKPNSSTDGFVALRSGFFGINKQGSYNLQSLCNSFLTNFSNISQNKLQYTETKKVVVKVPVKDTETIEDKNDIIDNTEIKNENNIQNPSNPSQIIESQDQINNGIEETNTKTENATKEFEFTNDLLIDKSIIETSSLATDYKNGVSKEETNSIRQKALDAINIKATEDLNIVADLVKEDLSRKLGSNYNSEKMDEILDNIIKKTVNHYDKNGLYSLKSNNNYTNWTYSYNTKNMVNLFVEFYNNYINENISTQNAEKIISTNIENKRVELEEKKDELKFLASCDLPNAILETSYENIYNDILNNLDANNYKDAEKNIQDRVNQELLNISGTPAIIKNKASVILGDTISYYQATMGLDFSTSPYKEVFEKALDNTIEKTIDSNSTKCDIVQLTENFEVEINSVLCETILTTETSEGSNTQTVSRLSRASATDPVKGANPKDPPIVTEYPAKTPGGSSFKLIDYTYERTLSSGKTLTLTKPNEGMNGAILEITTPDGETTQIKIKIGPRISKNKIEELMNVIRNLPEANIQDLAKEECTIQLFSKAELSTNAPGKVTAGTYNLATNAITIDCGNFDKIEPAVLLHELGHALDYVPNGAYSISKEQISSTKIYDEFWELKDSSKKTDYYAFKNNREFFAEYYTYKSLGYTSNFAQDLFEKKAYENVNQEMDKIIENIRKLDSDARVRQDNNENQTTSGNTNNGTTSGNTTTGPSNSNPKEEITSPVEIDKPESPSGSNPFEDSKNDINKYPNVDNPTNNNPWDDVNNFPDIDNSNNEDFWNNINNNNSNTENSNVSNNETPTNNNTSNTDNNSNETTLPDNDTNSKPSPGDGITTDIETGLNVNDIVDPSTPTIPGEDSGITITDSTTKEEIIHSLIDKTIDYYTEEAVKEAQKIYGEDANIKVDVECTVSEDGEIIVKVKTTVLDDKKTSTDSSNASDNSNDQGMSDIDIPQYEPGYYPGVDINVNDYINPSTGIINTDSLISDWSANGGEVYTFDDAFEISNIFDSISNAIKTGDWSSFFEDVSSSGGYNAASTNADRKLGMDATPDNLEEWFNFDKTGYEWWTDPANSYRTNQPGTYKASSTIYQNQSYPNPGPGEGMVEYERGKYMSEDGYRMMNGLPSKQEEFDEKLEEAKENMDESIDVNHGPFDSSYHTSSVLDNDYGERPDEIIEGNEAQDPFKDNNSNNNDSTNNNWTSNQGGTPGRPNTPGSSNNSNNSNNNPFGGSSNNSSTGGGSSFRGSSNNSSTGGGSSFRGSSNNSSTGGGSSFGGYGGSSNRRW